MDGLISIVGYCFVGMGAFQHSVKMFGIKCSDEFHEIGKYGLRLAKESKVVSWVLDSIGM